MKKNVLLTIMIILTVGLNFLQAQTFTNFTTDNGLPSNSVFATAVDSHNVKWFATLAGVARYNDTTWVVYTTADGLISNSINCIGIDLSGTVWAGTDDGVSKFNGSTWTSYTVADGLVNNTIKGIAAEAGAVWFATAGGVSKFDGTTWTKLTSANGLANDYVSCVAIDSDGNKWFGSSIGGVSKYNNSTFKIFTTADSLIIDNIVSLTIDASDNKWIGTYSGITKYNKTDQWVANYRKTSGMLNSFVKSLDMDSKGNLWVGLYDDYLADGGFSKFTGTAWTSYTITNGLVDKMVRHVKVDKKDFVWIATGTGVSRFADKADAIAGMEQKSVTIFPNPAKDYVILNNLSNASMVRICDITGQVRISSVVSGNSIKLNTESLSPGIYILQITAGSSGFSRKLIVE